MATVQYPIDQLPRDPDPASKIDVGALKAWWSHEEQNGAGLEDLIHRVKSCWPGRLPPDSWYIATYSTLITCGKPATIVPLFHHLTRGASSEDEIKRVGDRFKDLLMKLFTIIGIPQVITAVSHLAKAELAAVASLPASNADDDAVRTRLNAFLARDTQLRESPYQHLMPRNQASLPADALDQRGFDFMLQIYRHNLPNIMATWGRHQADFEQLEIRTIYGVALSDRTVLRTPEDSELVVLPGIMAQDVLGATVWHVRGLLRLGVAPADVDVVLGVVRQVASWAGRDLKETANLKASDVDVEWEPRSA